MRFICAILVIVAMMFVLWAKAPVWVIPVAIIVNAIGLIVEGGWPPPK